MRTIIVGTDFSQGSYEALDAAVDIANTMQAHVKILWVRRQKKTSFNEDQTRRLAADKLQQLCLQHAPRMKNDSQISWEICYGKVENVLSEQAATLHAPFVVIGTNGAEGHEKYWGGSTAVRVMQKVPCPTLIIREGYQFRDTFERIVVPVRINADSRQKVPPAAAIAKIFGSQVHILGLTESVSETNALKVYLKQVENYFASEGIAFTSIGRRYENYTDTVLQYCNEIKADLVVINTQQQKVIARLFLGTNAQQMVHRSTFPVMCVHPEDVFTVAR
ncbi:MAG: universal stress protein [Bacteroidales bacterium]|nr:universal stress protein [Bacteroidales bacterium]